MTSALAPGTVFGGRWVVERPLSSGGMGAVYIAKHADTGRRVALKVIKLDVAAGNEDAGRELAVRFQKETGALAAVSHPNVVTFLDSGVQDGTLFLVMELLAGKPLRAIMSAPVDAARAMRICADVCRALAAVHAQGIVHRDLKPENVFLVDAVGHDEIAKLIDFGIARLEERASANGAPAAASVTRTGAIVGTPGYIAPEQLQGQPATTASDVYAVGVMLYELVTGRFPFEAPNTHAMLVKQLIEPLPPPRALLPTIAPVVEQLILRFMERDPGLRVRSATDALAQLLDATRALASSSSSSPPAGLPPGAPTEMGTHVAPLPSPPVAVSRPTSPTGSANVVDVAALAPPAARRARRPTWLPAAIGAGAALVVVAAVAVARSGDGAPPRATSAVVDAGSAAVAAPVVASVAAPVDASAPASVDTGSAGATPAPPGAAVAAPANDARVERTPPSADADDDKRPAPLGARAKFVGTFNAALQGYDEVFEERTPVRASTKVTVAARGRDGLTLKFPGSPCTTTLVMRDDTTAVFEPRMQECENAKVNNGKRTNKSRGVLKLAGELVVFDVEGVFEFTPNRGAPVRGNFRHTWTLRRK